MRSQRRLALLLVAPLLGVSGCLVDDDANETPEGGTDTVIAVPMPAPVTDTVTITDTVTDTVNTVVPVPYPVPVPMDTALDPRRGAGENTGTARTDTAR